MTCHVCGVSVKDAALYRQNEKGVAGAWACGQHNARGIDPEVRDIVEVIEQDNAARKADPDGH